MLNVILKNVFLLSAIVLMRSSSKQDCPEGINLLPMYGEVKKCEQQIKSDTIFLAACDKQFKNRPEAARKYIEKAWEYFYENEVNTSMKRFNQAWLLDKDNADIYWGFGTIMGMRQELKKSIALFEKSLQLNPNNSKVYENISISYGQLFDETKKVEYLGLTVKSLKRAIKLDPNNAKYYGALTRAYSNYTQKDSLKKYLKITEKLDAKMIDAKLREIATQK